MKNYVLKPIVMIPLTMVLLFGCSKEEVLLEDIGEIEAKVDQTPLLPADESVMVEILGVRNIEGEVEGWYYYNQPDKVYKVESSNAYLGTKSSNTIVSLVGDMDAFGYSPSSTNPPCRYFDLSEPEDVGVFDKLIRGPIDSEKSWVHDFTNDPQFCSGFTAEEVTIQIREYMNSTFGTVKIQIDGAELDFIENGFLSKCSGKTNTIQTFTFTGAAAAFANDGTINIDVFENGEEIALDYSLVTIKYSLTNPTNTIVIEGCDTGVVDQLRSCKTLSELIDAAFANAKNHGQFVSEVSHLTNELVEEGLLSAEESKAIMNCTAQTK